VGVAWLLGLDGVGHFLFLVFSGFVCHSVLSFCFVILFCHSVLSFCFVILFCHSVLSFCFVFGRCYLAFQPQQTYLHVPYMNT